MFLLEIRDEKEMQQLFHAAYGLKLRYTGKMVSIRGLIEMGNVCAKDCFYCGIRKSNPNVERFQLDREAVLRMSRWAWKHNFGSIVMQSGEMESEEAYSVRRIPAEGYNKYVQRGTGNNSLSGRTV